MEFTPLVTLDDFKARGYDFLAPEALNLGCFASQDEAANDLIQECFDTIYNIIELRYGPVWTQEFFNDMKQVVDPSVKPKQWAYREALRWAIINHTIFIYDCGDKEASAKVNNDKLGISPKALRKLYSSKILEV